MAFKSRKEALSRFGTAIEERFSGSDEQSEVDVDLTTVENSATEEREHQLLGELLVEHGSVSADDLRDALMAQQSSDRRVGELLVELGALEPRALTTALGQQLGLDVVDLRTQTPAADALAKLDETSARTFSALPIRMTANALEVAVGDPMREGLREALETATGERVRILLASAVEIDQAIEHSYKATGRVNDAVRAFQVLHAPATQEQSTAQTVDENAPIVQVVNLILEQAVRDRASDIHIEPGPNYVRIRNRTDGALHEAFELPAAMGLALTSRIKIMSELNIVERRRSQDGQFAASVAGRDLDVRVATTPTVFGEKVVLRLLDKSRALLQMHELGMPLETEARFKDLVRSPYGMVICAGPTGSGKTTTLYATLTEINRVEINVMTIEDPVEYVFPQVNQIQINEQAGVTFAGGLRSILRQDPDAILVGEIRDVETARIAVQSALTGHFVMSSLHAIDSVAALHRFLDMGIESFLIASSLLGVVAERLVRRVCPQCKVPYDPTDEELDFYERADGPADPQFFRGDGCNFCAQTGYYDRIGIYEVMRVNDTIRRLILENAPQDVIRVAAVKTGMRSLANEAATLAGQGVTTIPEVLRSIFVPEMEN